MYRWHLGRALPLRDSNGTIIKWLGTCVDIHAQKEAEEQIRRLNEGLEFTVLDRTKDLRKEIRQRQRAEMRYRAHLQLLRRIIDMLPMAAVAADGRGAILYANQHFHDFFSLPENSVLHEENQTLEVVHALRRRFPSRDQEKILRTLLASDKAARQEIAADEGRTFQLEFIPTKREDIESGYQLLVRDISQEKKIDNAKSEFMSLASHQLRTPLTAIRWALGRLGRRLQGKIDPADERLLERSHKSAATMAETIATMLSISRIEAGLLAVKKTVVPHHSIRG
jgi:PAS domain S-box-containing protein